MKRLLILVEGQTEERFVSTVLRDHLMARSVFPTSTILVTKFVQTGPRKKGGVSSWNQIQRDLKRLLGDTGAAGVTTLLDYYALPGDVPGMADRPARPPRERVEHVERAIAAQLPDHRFRPHLMLHEFEAMLFADISKWQHRFDDAAILGLQRDVAGLEPEAINETPGGAPSKRIAAHLDHYRKVVHGPLAAADIGLNGIRAACPHFAAWLSWLEGLGDPAGAEI